ncbi:MAG: integrase core domain-containing protein [Synechococcaceae cyanobacterium]|nr:integrase core domain-containing protein [Synechococcaceae cyanobacterium]
MERLWRMVKYEEVYLRAYSDGWEAEISLARFLWRYCHVRPHSSLGFKTPYEVYTEAEPYSSRPELTTSGAGTVQYNAPTSLSLPAVVPQSLGKLCLFLAISSILPCWSLASPTLWRGICRDLSVDQRLLYSVCHGLCGSAWHPSMSWIARRDVSIYSQQCSRFCWCAIDACISTCGFILEWCGNSDASMGTQPALRALATLQLYSGTIFRCLRSGSTVSLRSRPSGQFARLPEGMRSVSHWLACIVLTLVLMGGPARLATALQMPSSSQPLSSPASYRCDGDLLQVQYEAGAVDDPDIPNSLAGTLPGAFVLIDWRDQHLQLPRTNNSSAVPSYSDGRWWWRPVSAEQPEFRQRRGSLISYACEPATPAQEAPLAPGTASGPGV